jgi:1-acyl-sn-glycerol-3-phosphate acyltransferase
MIGTEKVQPIGQRFPSIRRVGIIFGRPLDFSEYYERADDRAVQRLVTDRIMQELQRLSGQQYVDVYAATVKAQLAAEQEARRKAGTARGEGTTPAA